MEPTTSGLTDPQTLASLELPALQASPTRNLGGRPRLSDDQRKTVRIRVGFTLMEAEQIDELASEAGVDAFQLIRAAALKQKISVIPTVNREAVVELIRVGNNLNQAVRRMNSGEDEDLVKEILDIQSAINDLKSSLLKAA